jgi:hypothetical protein
MSQNLISSSLSAEDAAAIRTNLSEAKAKLTFLLSLQTDDVATLFKVGNAYLPFIDLAYQTMIDHPEILPQVFDKAEFLKDYELLSSLRPIYNQINELAEGIKKTFMAVGSDSLVASLEIYDAVKQNKDKVPGLAVTASEMAVFFKRTRTKTEAGK